MMASSAPPTIPEWFRGSRVLITGGSGFMGKVLVEKLLRSCPDLDTIYLLLRPKKGKPPSSRIQDITSQPLFDKLRVENPAAFNKLVAVPGDVKELGLGLSDEDRRTLQQQVDVVFHTAASVRFDDPIRDAVLINVRGTREVVNLALGMDDLKAFLHLSTTYCNRVEPEVLEQLYPPPGDWRAMIRLVEEAGEDDAVLRCLTPKILGARPNTYTYAKALSEHVINDHKDKIPMVILRPSIVLPSSEEPMPGWIDNYNGPVGMWTGNAYGIVRCMLADPNNVIDQLPVDVAIKFMIFAVWHRALLSADRSTPVYNCCSVTEPWTIRQLQDDGVELCKMYPNPKMVWFPGTSLTANRLVYFLKVIAYHVLPALLLDAIMRLSGRRPFVMKLQRRIYIALNALSYFITNDFHFSNANFMQLQTSHMSPDDVTDFGYNRIFAGKPWTDYKRRCYLGTRLYLMKFPLDCLPRSKVIYWRMYWLDRAVKVTALLTLVWVVGTCGFVRHHLSTMHHMILFDIEGIMTSNVSRNASEYL